MMHEHDFYRKWYDQIDPTAIASARNRLAKEFMEDIMAMLRDYGAAQVADLENRFASFREMHENALAGVERALAPEWEDAQREVFETGNQGWNMIVDEAVSRLRQRR